MEAGLARTTTFVPRLILPLSLSYDHRVIDGADAARFTRTPRRAARRTCAHPALMEPGRAAEEVRADLLVLGAGPGGYTAAFRAADLGRQVVLVERHPTLGGVCLNVGCIPSKALLHVAERASTPHATSRAPASSSASPALDLGRSARRKNAVVETLTGGLAELATQRGVRS